MDMNSNNITKALQNGSPSSTQVGAYNTYIGARYVPIFEGEWNPNTAYEPLTIVTNEGNSYTSRTYVPIGIPINNNQYWALTSNFNSQLEDIYNKLNEIPIFNPSKMTKGISLSLIMEKTFYPGDTYNPLQGGCYVEDNKYVLAYSLNNGCSINLYNASTYEIEWSYTFPNGGHGNTVTFNPNNRLLYITSITPNQIFTISYDNPGAGVINTYTFNTGNNCYSAALDVENQIWYVVHYLGHKAGQFNRLYRYNIDFSSPLGYLDLEFPISNLTSWQGAHVIVNNTIYGLIYEPVGVIYGWNLITGKIESCFPVNEASGYKPITEVENLSYNKDKNNLILGFISNSDENGHYPSICLAETSIIGGMDYNSMKYYNSSSGKPYTLTVDYAGNGYVPAWKSNKFKTLQDAVYFSRKFSCPTIININNSSTSVATINRPYINKFNGTINCSGTVNFITPCFNDSKLQIQNGHFSGSVVYNGINCCVYVSSSELYIAGTQDSDADYLFYINNNSKVTSIIPTTNNAAYLNNGGEIMQPNKSKFGYENYTTASPTAYPENVNIFNGPLTTEESDFELKSDISGYFMYQCIYRNSTSYQSINSNQGVQNPLIFSFGNFSGQTLVYEVLNISINFNTKKIKLITGTRAIFNSDGVTISPLTSVNLNIMVIGR